MIKYIRKDRRKKKKPNTNYARYVRYLKFVVRIAVELRKERRKDSQQ